MNFKRLVSLFVCVCIICSAVFTLVACKDKKSDVETTESNVETESVSEDVETDSTGDKWVSEFVDSTVEDGSTVYKTRKNRDKESETVFFTVHCFIDDVEKWVYETTISTGGQYGDGSQLMAFDEKNVYISIARFIPEEKTYSSTIAIDKKTGEEVWHVNGTGFADILLDDENVYVSGFDGNGLYIISKDGKVKAEDLGSYGHLVFIDANTIAMFPEYGRVDVDVSAYKSKDTIPEKIYKCLPISITASSTLEPSNDKTYDAKNLTDRDPATVWSEGEEGLGEGTTLTVDLGETTTITGLYIRAGHHGSEELFKKNGMPVEVEITFNNGSETKIGSFSRNTEEWEIIGTYTEAGPIECSSFTIKILEAEAGTEYDDVCISDIEVYSAKLWTD